MSLKYRTQPDLPFYGFDALETESYNRESFLRTFGVQAPARDPKRRLQDWFDPDAANLPPDEMYIYGVHEVGAGGTPRKRQAMITNAEAATVNLPGAFVYPAAVVRRSGAWNAITNEQGEAVGKNYITANALTEKDQALALIAELRLNGIEVAPDPVRADLSGPYTVRYEPEETRRIYNVVFNGGQQNAGLLLETRNKQGNGAPGVWVQAAIGNGVMWRSAPTETGELDTRPRVPRPMRDLYANETYRVAGFSVGIKRTDKSETAVLDHQTNIANNVVEILTLVRGLVTR